MRTPFTDGKAFYSHTSTRSMWARMAQDVLFSPYVNDIPVPFHIVELALYADAPVR